jgi:hypothetical protein
MPRGGSHDGGPVPGRKVSGTAAGGTGRRVRRAGAGSVLRHAAGRPGRRRRPHRPAGRTRRTDRRPRVDVAAGSRQALDRARPQGPRRPRRRAGAGRAGRRPAGGVPARCHGTPGPRARRAAGVEAVAGLRPDDRLGPDRTAGELCRARHRVHRAAGGAGCVGPARRGPGAADEPAGRFRGRGSVPCAGRGGRTGARPGDGGGAGGGRRDRGRHRRPDHDDPRAARRRRLARPARCQPAGHGCAVLRRLPLRRRAVPRRRRAGGAVLRGAAGRPRPGGGRVAARPERPAPVAGAAGAVHRGFRLSQP